MKENIEVMLVDCKEAEATSKFVNLFIFNSTFDRHIKVKKIKVSFYEPVLTKNKIFNSRVIKDLKEIKKISDFISVKHKTDIVPDFLR